MFDCVTSNNLLEVFATFESYHRCVFKHLAELGVYLQDIPVSIHNFRYVRECSCMLLMVKFCFCCYFLYLSILLTFFICSSRTSSLYCRSRNFYLMIAQFLSHSVLVEQIVFGLKVWPHGMLLFRDPGCSDLACKNSCLSVGLRYKVVWMLLFSSLYNIASSNAILLGKTWKSNLIVLRCSF